MSRYVHLDSHISDVIRNKTVKHDIIHADLYVSNNCQWSSCNLCAFQDPKFMVFQYIIFAIVFYHTEFVIGCVRRIYLNKFLDNGLSLVYIQNCFCCLQDICEIQAFSLLCWKTVQRCEMFPLFTTLSIDFKESRIFIVEILAGVGTTFPAIVNLS